jgi:hypothetical protein
VRRCSFAASILVLALVILSTGGVAGATSWWQPGPGALEWQWELDHPLSTADPQDLGLARTLPDGSPAAPPSVYDIDGIDNSAATVTSPHERGAKVICYIEVGSAGNYYSASQEGLRMTYYQRLKQDGLLGRTLSSYPERFVDIRSPQALAIMRHMIRQQCASKGFDAVETDLDETYSGAEGPTGFPLSRHDEVTYLSSLASFMHSLGLAWVIKNPDDTGDNFATIMEPLADAVLTEQCNEFASCGSLRAYVGHKAVFNAEYKLSTASFCAADAARGFNGVRFDTALDGIDSPCR